jgi:hypothetical protein
VDRDPAAGSSRIDDRDTTPINDDACCNPCLLAVHRRQVPRLSGVFTEGGGPAERKIFFRSGWKGGQTSFNGLDVRPPPPPPFGLWLAGETGRTDIE